MGMNEVLTLRLSDEEMETITELSKAENADKSRLVRELLQLGRVYRAVIKYKEGSLSLGLAAEISGMPLSEFMEVLADFGVPSNIDVQDYLAGAAVAEILVKKKRR